MVRLRFSPATLDLEVVGMHKIWALKSRLQIPLSSIASARADAELAAHPRGLRAPGTYIPKLIVAGTFYADHKRWFWDVSDPAKAIVIELKGEKYQMIVVEVADPKRALIQIETARVK